MSDQAPPKRSIKNVDGKSAKPRVKRISAKAGSTPDMPAPYASASVMAAVPALEATVRPAGETTVSPPSSSAVTPAPIRADTVPPAAEMAASIAKHIKNQAIAREAAVIAWVTATIDKNKDEWEAFMTDPGKWKVNVDGYYTTINMPSNWVLSGDHVREMQHQLNERYPTYKFSMCESVIAIIIKCKPESFSH